MYPNNELVKMGTFVINTKISHRYSDSVSTAQGSGFFETKASRPGGRSVLRPVEFWEG